MPDDSTPLSIAKVVTVAWSPMPPMRPPMPGTGLTDPPSDIAVLRHSQNYSLIGGTTQVQNIRIR
jgi:hypothetical protein